MKQANAEEKAAVLADYLKEFGAELISSRTNPKTVRYAKLSDKKYRDEFGLFLAEGSKLTAEALQHAEVECVLIAQSKVEALAESDTQRKPGMIARELAAIACEKQVPVHVFADSAFEKISTEQAPQGFIAVVKKPEKIHMKTDFEAWQQGKRLLMLDEIRDPGNLGTILRSAEAMGIEGVILASCADLYSEKTVRAAMGTLFRIPVYITQNGADCVRSMKICGRRVISAGLGEHTLTLGQYATEKTDCVVIGNEGHGVSAEVLAESTACVRIPMAGQTESLNAAAAAVCILWEYFRN